MADKIGVWIVGAGGNVATTSLLGLAALQRGQAPTVGLVSELPLFASLGLVDWSQLVAGGHDIRQPQLMAAARRLPTFSR